MMQSKHSPRTEARMGGLYVPETVPRLERGEEIRNLGSCRKTAPLSGCWVCTLTWGLLPGTWISP